ncbi:MAG: MFS transporter [Saprospiraceae bacterium]|nr:MFS transporter [Saprospiraceae bacterium]
MSQNKPTLNFWQIWNMSFGFLGVQYAFGLQQANMSPIYRYLHAEESQIPLLWLAGPITGLLVQPLIGAMSDATWHPFWGRRRPYFMIGAVLTSVALILMPMSTELWMAAGLLWLLDGSANVTMEPFRAFVADKLPEKQRPLGFTMQSFFVGLGQTLANLMPFLLPAFGLALVGQSGGEGIPDFVRYSFFIGAVAILVSIAVTVLTTREYPPEDMEEFRLARKKGFMQSYQEIVDAFRDMPRTMRQLWWVKFFTWYALPLMWQYLSLSIARHCFNAPNADAPGFEDGVRWGNMGLAVFNIACFGVSFFLVALARQTSSRVTHAICLSLAGVGFVSMLFTTDVMMVMVCMGLVGIGWASIMSMPYVMLSNSVPESRMGVYMGIFNMFIVIPQIINMITIPLLYKPLLGDDPRHALVLAGVMLFFAAGACFLVDRSKTN